MQIRLFGTRYNRVLMAILRDRGVARVQALPIEWAELEARICAEVRVDAALRLVDAVTGSSAWASRSMSRERARMNSPVSGRERSGTRRHPGRHHLRLPSQRRGQHRPFDRALAKVEATATPRLIDSRGELARIISKLDLAII